MRPIMVDIKGKKGWVKEVEGEEGGGVTISPDCLKPGEEDNRILGRY